MDSNMLFPLETDNGTVMVEVLALFSVDTQEYIALIPVDDNGSTNIFFYRFNSINDDYTLGLIENEDEFNSVLDVFDKRIE